jgi:hypothetical protein
MPNSVIPSRPRIAALALAAAAALAASGGPPAEAAVSCSFADAVVQVRLTEHGDVASLVVQNGIRVEGTGGQKACGTATTQNTDAVLIVDESDNFATPAGNDGDTTVKILQPYQFRPGKTDEPYPNEDEIEFFADTRGGYDRLLSGASDTSEIQDLVVGSGGLSWNSDFEPTWSARRSTTSRSPAGMPTTS